MAKKKYTSYQPSKTLWQVEIPSHWQETDLRMVFLENKERNTGLIERNLLSLSYGKLKRKDIDNATGLVPASFEGYQIIGKGYIVLRFTDLQNDKKSLRVGYCPERGIITNAYVAIAPKENTFSKYYYYQLHFLDTIKYFYNLGGGVRQSLSYKEFGREAVIVPEPEEQIKIAAFLDYKLAKIDRFIRKKKQLIKLLNEQKAAIINQAVTKGLDPNAKMKPSGIEWLGDIPEHWEVKKLKYVANCFPSNIDKHSKENERQVRLCNYTDVYKNDFITNNMELMIATATNDQIDKFTLLEGDVIITKDSETADDIANPALVIEELENVVCGYHLSVLRPYSNLEGSYLLRALQCKVINVQFEVCSNGVTRVGLGVYDMKSAKIPLPPKDEQQLIVNHIESEVDKIHKTISTIEKEITLTQEYKTALIAEAVTGKIDVRDFEIPETLDEETYEDLEEELSEAAEGDAEYQNEEIEE
jgi:type I restriction enzyme, S subunit